MVLSGGPELPGSEEDLSPARTQADGESKWGRTADALPLCPSENPQAQEGLNGWGVWEGRGGLLGSHTPSVT